MIQALDVQCGIWQEGNLTGFLECTDEAFVAFHGIAIKSQRSCGVSMDNIRNEIPERLSTLRNIPVPWGKLRTFIILKDDIFTTNEGEFLIKINDPYLGKFITTTDEKAFQTFK